MCSPITVTTMLVLIGVFALPLIGAFSGSTSDPRSMRLVYRKDDPFNFWAVVGAYIILQLVFLVFLGVAVARCI